MQYTTVTFCDAGLVMVDAGDSIPADICERHTSVGLFKGGFMSQYQMTNSNTQPSGAGDFQLTAGMNVQGNTASATLAGHAQ
jgi:hypothetical protein